MELVISPAQIYFQSQSWTSLEENIDLFLCMCVCMCAQISNHQFLSYSSYLELNFRPRKKYLVAICADLLFDSWYYFLPSCDNYRIFFIYLINSANTYIFQKYTWSAYNPRYSGVRDQEDHISKPAWASSS
jgi:hypothetical protein